ncbi:MAG: hypothetical protein ACI3YZ_05785 [Prevotella sp.]
MKQTQDEKTLREIRSLIPEFKTSVGKLGVVLEELCGMLAADGSGVDIFLLQYVAEARGNLRYLIEIADEEKGEEKSVKTE